MSKKKKQRIQAPALSALDKGIYYCLVVGSIFASIFLYPAIVGSYRRAVFRDTHILAQSTPGTLFLCIFGLLIGGGFALVSDWLRRKKQPVFGKADITYGPPQWKPVYPFLSKQFWRNPHFKARKPALFSLCFLISVLIAASATLLCLTPRNCLYDDGTVTVYSCFNKLTAEYNPSDVTKIRIYTRTYPARLFDDWGLELEISMNDGETFFFPYRDFQTLDSNIRGSITGMQKIKSCFDPSIIIIEGKDDLAYVIQDMNLNQHETDLLYSLFDVNESPQ